MTAYVGDGPPGQYQLTLVSTDGTDLSLVTEAVLKVQLPDLTHVDWAVDISGQTSTNITLTHAFADGGIDLPMPGLYYLYAMMTVPTGVIRSSTQQIPIFNVFETQ